MNKEEIEQIQFEQTRSLLFQLQEANDKIEKIREYINKDLVFVENNSSHLHYRHLTEILSIIDGSDK